MNDKIQNLLMELVKECRKEEICSRFATVDPERMEPSVFYLQVLCLNKQLHLVNYLKNLKESLLMIVIVRNVNK